MKAASSGSDEMVAALRKFGKAFSRPRRRLGAADAAREAVGAMGMRGPRAALMEAWAVDAAPRLAEGARHVINQDQYDKLCARFRRELLRSWIERSGEKLGFGRAGRLVDSIMMALGESESLRSAQAAPFLRAPLDARTIGPLKSVINELTEIDWSIEIPARPTADFITTEELYYLVQNVIADLAGRAGISQIDYAYWCARRV